MKHQISFKHMAHNKINYEEIIKAETDKIQKYLDSDSQIKWTCSKDGNFFKIELQLFALKFKRYASARSDTFEKTCEMAVVKLVKQLRKKKDRMTNKLHRKQFELVILDPENAWIDYDEDYYADVG